MTLSALLSDRAKKTPGQICIKFEKRRISYAELDRLVSLLSGGLQSLGLKSGDRVAVLMGNCPEYIIAYFAIVRAGGIVVPVNTFLTPDEISYMLNDSGCKILLHGTSFALNAEKIKNKVQDLRALTFHEVPPKELQSHIGNEDDTAVFLYTSGTTGFPKGAMLTHKNLVSNARACAEVMDVSKKDKILLFLPLFHSFSLTVCVLLPVYAGGTIVLLTSVKPFSKVLDCVFRERVTLFVAVPTVYNILSRKKIHFLLRFLLKFLIKVRLCVSGAAALPAATLSDFEERYRLPLIEGYGLTEASPVVAVNPLRGTRKPSSVGLPLSGVEVRIIGDDGNELPTGQAGELIVRGPNIMKGYYNKKAETDAVLKNGWLYTGDMARVDDQGYIYIVDRKKDIIIVDGMNIYPREVEDRVMGHPSVEECAMVGVQDGRGSELTVLFIKKKENAVADEKEIKDFLKGKVAQFKIPRKIRFIDELPKTATGKVKKIELRSL